MVIDYPNNTSDNLLVSFHRHKIGCTNYFMVHYNGVSSFASSSKEVRSKYGVAKFTDAIKRLGVWCDEMIATYSSNDSSRDSNDMEEVEVSPTDNTRMVV